MNVSNVSRTLKPQHVLIGILLIQAILGTAYALAAPLWREHEADFYTVTRFVVENGRLPTASDYPANDAEIRQATQPPLYFLLAYPVVALLDDGQRVPPGSQPAMICVGDNGANDPAVQYPITTAYIPPVSGAVAGGYGLRLLNLLLGMAATVLTYRAGRVLFPTRPAVALIAAALLAFEGNMIRLYSEISNDTLLVTLSAANVLICAHLAKRLTPRMIFLLIVTAGLALITRLQGWALLAFDIPFILLVSLIQPHVPLSTRVRRVLIPAGVLLLAGVVVVLFNLIAYGSVLGRYSSLGGSIASAFQNFRPPWVTIVGVANLTYSAYQEPLLALGPRAIFITAYGVLVLGGIVASIWLLARVIYQRKRTQIGALLILSGTVLIALLLVLFRNTLTADAEHTTLYNSSGIYAPIRYYAPGLPAAALLLSAGLMSLIPARFGWRAQSLPGIGAAGCWLLVSALGCAVIVINRPSSPILTPAEYADVPGLTAVDASQPPNIPRVLAYHVSERPADGIAELTLYLTTDTPLNLSYYAQVDLLTTDGQELTRCEFLPARGVYPTTLWQPDQIIKATAEIPNCSEAMSLPAQLTLRWFGVRRNGALVNQQTAPLVLAPLSAVLEKAASCPAKLGVIAGNYQIVKFNSPPAVQPGETYLPSLNWLVFDPDPRAEARIFTFTHTDTDMQYTCTGSLAPQIYDVSTWQHGQEVYFDTCTMKFPPDASPGIYRVEAGILDADEHYLEAVSASGDPLPTGMVYVGEVELVR